MTRSDAKGRPRCKTCGAARSTPCRSKSGRIVRTHWSRVVATVDEKHAALARDAWALLAKFGVRSTKIAAKPRRWRKLGPHEHTLRMGPVTIEVSRYHTARDQAADRWEWKAVVRATPRPLYITGRTYGVDGAPLARCKSDSVAAVERWRDGIR